MSKDKIHSELFEVIWSNRQLYYRAAFFSLLVGLLTIAPALYMLEVYDRVVNSFSMITLAMLTLLVLGAYLLMGLFDWLSTQIMQGAGKEMDEKLRVRIFDAIFSSRVQGSALGNQQALSDLRTLREFLYGPALKGIFEMPASIVFFMIVYSVHPILGYLTLFVAVVQIGIAIATERKTHPPLQKANQLSSQARNYINDSFRNSEVIESMGMLNGIHDRWMKKQKSFLAQQALASDMAGSLTAVSKSLMLMKGSAGLGLGVWLKLSGATDASMGMILVGSILGARIVQPIVQVVSSWKTVIEARESYQRLDNLLLEVPAPREHMALPVPVGRLSVEGVSALAPGTRSLVLRNVSLELNPGESLAVVGPSGSGKSSLARLLIGLWAAQSGKVRLDGVDLATWNKEELGPYIGYLPQDVELFDGSIGENIARFGDADLGSIMQAVATSGLGDLVENLENGLETEIGLDGGFLSGGQRQRVAIARAIYRLPKLVVLDEPDSNLDEVAEGFLVAMLKELKHAGITVVMITHQKSLLRYTDKILILREGAVQTFGETAKILEAARAAQQRNQEKTTSGGALIAVGDPA